MLLLKKGGGVVRREKGRPFTARREKRGALGPLGGRRGKQTPLQNRAALQGMGVGEKKRKKGENRGGGKTDNCRTDLPGFLPPEEERRKKGSTGPRSRTADGKFSSVSGERGGRRQELPYEGRMSTHDFFKGEEGKRKKGKKNLSW